MTHFSERRLCMFAGETPQRQPAANDFERTQEVMRTGHDVQTTADMRRQSVNQLFQGQRTAGAKETTDPSRTVSFAPGQLLIRTRPDGSEVRNSVQTTRFFDANGNATITRIGGGGSGGGGYERSSSTPVRPAPQPRYVPRQAPQMAYKQAPEPEPDGRADIHLTPVQRQLFAKYFQEYQQASLGLQQQLLTTKPRTTDPATLAEWQLQVKAQLEPYKQQYMEKLRADPAWMQSQQENPVYLNNNGYGAAWGASNFEQREATAEENRAIAEVLEKYEQALIRFNATLPRGVPQAALLGPLNAFKAQQCQILNAELASKGLQVRMNRGNYYDIRIGIDARTLRTGPLPQDKVGRAPEAPSPQTFAFLKPIIEGIFSLFRKPEQSKQEFGEKIRSPERREFASKLDVYKDTDAERMKVLLGTPNPGTYGNFEDPLHQNYAEDFNNLDADMDKLSPASLQKNDARVADVLPALKTLDVFFQSAKKTGNMAEFLKRANQRLTQLGQTSIELVEDNGKLSFTPTKRADDSADSEQNNARIER